MTKRTITDCDMCESKDVQGAKEFKMLMRPNDDLRLPERSVAFDLCPKCQGRVAAHFFDSVISAQTRSQLEYLGIHWLWKE